MSKCRQNYHDETEAGINKQINIELFAHYSYLAMVTRKKLRSMFEAERYVYRCAAFYDRDDVALKGFSKFFMDSAKEEHEHADKFIKYQHLRGGRVVFQPIDRPAQDSWDTTLAAMEYALNMEKQVNQALLDLHRVAESHNDSHLTNFLEEEYLKEQAESMNKLAKYITNLQCVGDGLGVYIFDKDLQE